MLSVNPVVIGSSAVFHDDFLNRNKKINFSNQSISNENRAKINSELLQAYFLPLPKKVSFGGMSQRLSPTRISSFADAIAQWQRLSHAKYTDNSMDTASREIMMANKAVRRNNFSFLDALTTRQDKMKFIEHFKKLTGFPDLEASTDIVLKEFDRVVDSASQCFKNCGGKVLLSGYDPVCSVGLRKAWPGSDLDKGFVVLQGNSGNMSDNELVNQFKGHLWNNMDQRILSINHPDAFTNVYTERQITNALDELDKNNFVKIENMQSFLDRHKESDPISGAYYNILLSEILPNSAAKMNAKNLAYLIESIRDGKISKIDPQYSMRILSHKMKNSPFAWFSNVSQMKALENEISSGARPLKEKLQSREVLAEKFDTLSVDEQYDCIKNVIKSMCSDNDDPRFNVYFDCEPNIRRLQINDILTGKITYGFKDGKEHLTFNDQETARKYTQLASL